MKTPLFKFSLRAVGTALVAFASAAVLHAQSTGTLYWNTDNDDGSITIESNGALSSDQAGNVPAPYNDGSDIIFSSDKVGTEAQTITFDSGSGYPLNSLTFLKGDIALTGPTAILLYNGLTVGTNAGPTSISLQDAGPITDSIETGTIYYEQSSWNNNSASDLTINANVASYTGVETLTFDGTGTGAIHINGSVSGKIIQESATSTVFMGNRNGITSLNLSNGGQVWFTTSDQYITPTVTTTDAGGEIDFSGDTFLANNGSNVTFNATTLTFGAGDALDASSTAQNITTLNLDGSHVDGSNNPIFSRLIVGFTNNSGLNLLANTQTINVSNNYILDFGFGNNGGAGYTFNGTVNFASGSALEERNNSYVILANAVLPTSGTFTIGDDDAGGGFFTLEGTSNLTGPLTVTEKGHNSGADFHGNITGTGSLTFTGIGGQNNGTSYLSGTNSFNGLILAPTSGDNAIPIVDITGDSSGIGSIQVQRGILELATGAKVPTGSPIVLGSTTDDSYSVLRIGDSTSANVTVYGVTSIHNEHTRDTIVGTGSAGSQLTWDIETGTNEYDGSIGNGPYLYNDGNAANLQLIKTGAGTLMITRSDNVYTGGTVIDAGTLSVFGAGNYGAGQAANGTGTITINNAATLNVMNAQAFDNQIVLGTKGTLTVNGGDTYQVAAQLSAFNSSGGGIDSVMADPNAATGNGQAGIVGGNGIAIVGGDVLVAETEVTTPGEVDVVGGRLLMFNNDDFIDGATKIVTAGGTLDFGAGGTRTVSVPVYFGANGAIETRGTNTTITNLAPVVGTSGAMPSLTIGTDDVGSGSITVQNSVDLTNSTGGIQLIGVQADNRGFTSVNFAGGFSGTGNLTYDTAGLANNYITGNRGFVTISGTNTYQGDTTVQGGILELTGNNAGVTSTGGGAPNYYIVATAKSYVDDSNDTHTIGTPGTLQIGPGGTLASNANVVVGGTSGFAFLVLGDNNGAANVSVGNISVSGAANDNGAILGGSASISTLTVNVNGGTDVYAGIFGNSHGYNFDDTSDGNLNSYQNNLAVVFNIGAGGVMDLQGFNPGNSIAGGFIANGGTLKVDGNAGGLGNSNVTLNNTDLQVGNNSFGNSSTSPHVIIGTGTNRLDAEDGIDNFSGDIQSGAGSVINVSGSNFLFSSDNTASTIGTLNIDGGRIFLLNSTGLNIIANNTTVNVTNGAFFDFATSTTSTITNQINFSSGTGLVGRNNNTVITLTNANLPTAGSFTIGSDDVGNTSGSSYKITSDLALTGDLQLNVIGNSNIPVTLAGNISGNGGITEGNGGQNGGNLYLTGTNTYSGTTSATFANLFIDGDNSGAGVNYFSNFSTITIGHGGQIASNAHLQFGNGGGGTFVLGDGNGAVSQTIASLDQLGTGAATVYNGNTLDTTNSVLTVNNPSTDNFSGTLGNSSVTNGNNMALVKKGAGTLTLSGTNTYTGGTTVSGGKLAVDGSIAGNAQVDAGAEIGGHGSIAGTLSGAGAVGPGNSPGILTASEVDPSGGTSFNFEFTLALPDFTNAANSGNDVLHLESGTPFLAALTSANAINLYFASAGSFEGGFFTNGLVDNLTANVADATYNYFVLDAANGAYTYNGNRYDLATGLETTVPALGAAFGDGTADGFTQDFVVTSVSIPEPSTYALIGAALLVLVVFVRRRHAV